MTVHLVELHVTATDRRGELVDDLTRGDFRVLEDGEPVDITHFEILRSPERRSAPPARTSREIPREEPSSPPRKPLRLVIYVDSVHTGPASRARFLQDLWTLVRERLSPDDEIMLVSYDGKLRIELAPTTERRRVPQVLAAFEFLISLCDGTGAAQGVVDAFDVRTLPASTQTVSVNPSALRMEMMEFQTTDMLRDVVTHASAHGIRLYTLQGVVPEVSISPSYQRREFTTQVASAMRLGLQDALVYLARETGGKAMLHSPGFVGDIERVLDNLSVGYLIAYRAPETPHGSIHEIKVEVERPGVRLQQARSRRTDGPDERVVDHLMTALLYGVGPNPLGVEVRPKLKAGTATRVQVSVPLERLTLMDLGPIHHGTLTVFLTAGNLEEGRAMAVRQKSVVVVVPSGDLPPEFVVEIGMGADISGLDLAVAVRDDLGGRVSFDRHRAGGDAEREASAGSN